MSMQSLTELVKADQDHLIHSLHHPMDHAEPLICVKGRGTIITDVHGREYLDGLAGLWNVNVGHGREELAEAAAAQMKELAYFSTYVGSSNIPAINLADRLIRLSYKTMVAVFFTCGGAEANESAFKTARVYWKTKGKADKVKVIAGREAYYGVTLQAMSATGMSLYWKMFEPRVPGFVHIQPPYAYRFQGAQAGESVGQAAARELEEAILREGPDTVAAFIAEPIQGAGGVIVPPDTYWPKVQRICDEYGVLLISDEVITGFGRLGEWFGADYFGTHPDFMPFAKGVTSGYLPLGGVMISDRVAETLIDKGGEFHHGYTYSGHPAACAVAIANIKILQDENLVERVKSDIGPYLQAGWKKLAEHPIVGEARMVGLMGALEIVADKNSLERFEKKQGVGTICRDFLVDNGLVMRAVGDTIVTAPPFVLSHEEADELVTIAWKCLDLTQAALQ